VWKRRTREADAAEPIIVASYRIGRHRRHVGADVLTIPLAQAGVDFVRIPAATEGSTQTSRGRAEGCAGGIQGHPVSSGYAADYATPPKVPGVSAAVAFFRWTEAG